MMNGMHLEDKQAIFCQMVFAGAKKFIHVLMADMFDHLAEQSSEHHVSMSLNFDDFFNKNCCQQDSPTYNPIIFMASWYLAVVAQQESYTVLQKKTVEFAASNLLQC